MSVNRRLARSPRTMPQLSTAANTVESEHVCSNYPPIKHIPFPSQASQFQSDLINEWLLFAFSFWAAGLQFLHLYRTVWWLPDSYTNQTMVKFKFFFFWFFDVMILRIRLSVPELLSHRSISGVLSVPSVGTTLLVLLTYPMC